MPENKQEKQENKKPYKNPDDPDNKPAPKPRTVGPAAGAAAILESMMMPDEKILHQVTISTGIYWKGLSVAVIALLLMLKVFNLGAFLLLVSAIMLLISHLTRHFLLLAATDRRIIMRAGILNLDVIQLRYSKVESVEVAWTVMGQLLGYASDVVTGTGSRVIIIPFVRDASIFRNVVNAQLMAREDKEKPDS